MSISKLHLDCKLLIIFYLLGDICLLSLAVLVFVWFSGNASVLFSMFMLISCFLSSGFNPADDYR